MIGNEEPEARGLKGRGALVYQGLSKIALMWYSRLSVVVAVSFTFQVGVLVALRLRVYAKEKKLESRRRVSEQHF